MPRNFGLRARDPLDRFWNEQPDGVRDERWAWWLIAGSVLMIVGIGILIA